MAELQPVYWPIADLLTAFRARELSPVEVARDVLERIEVADPQLNAFLAVTAELALEQARLAEDAYRRGESGALLGVPVSVKDAFDLAGVPTTLGSLIHRDDVAAADSGVVGRLRAAGAVIVGKTNTAEFGQSATTENRLRAAARNPWDPMRTPGGSSGGAAASVAAGLATIAVGSDGGGSVRIPAAFTGLFGLKPTQGLCRDEGAAFRAMSDFVSPGPLAWRASDARVMLEVLAGRALAPRGPGRLRIAWCARPEGRPVAPEVAAIVAEGVAALARLGHDVAAVDLPLAGWEQAFGPLVLDEERRERGHLLETRADELSSYELQSLRQAARLTSDEVELARRELIAYRERIAGLFADYDLLCTPTVAVPAFPIGRRPRTIDGERVSALWGAFPFTVPFNVALTSAATLPCGFADGVPVGLQLVARAGSDGLLLDVSERVEEALGFDRAPVVERWADIAAASGSGTA